jgi:hypothetical protein
MGQKLYAQAAVVESMQGPPAAFRLALERSVTG